MDGKRQRKTVAEEETGRRDGVEETEENSYRGRDSEERWSGRDRGKRLRGDA